MFWVPQSSTAQDKSKSQLSLPETHLTHHGFHIKCAHAWGQTHREWQARLSQGMCLGNWDQNIDPMGHFQTHLFHGFQSELSCILLSSFLLD